MFKEECLYFLKKSSASFFDFFVFFVAILLSFLLNLSFSNSLFFAKY